MKKDELMEALQDASDEAEGLRSEVHTALSSLRLMRRIIVVLAVGVILLAYLSYSSYSNAESSRTLLLRTAELQADIKDCVSPDGQCAQRGSKQTAAAVVNIEVVRNESEIKIAERCSTDDNVCRAQARKDLVAEYQAQVAELLNK